MSKPPAASLTLAARIGAAVRAERKRQRLSQQELALVAGIGDRAVGLMENGKETSRLDVIARVLDALGLEIEIAPRRMLH